MTNNFYDYTIFYKQDMTVPNKYNEVYLGLLDELWSKYPELHKAGIYGIYFNKKLVYVGQATDIAKRWVSHVFNWSHDFSESYHTPKYIALRHLADLGELEFKIIHTVEGNNIKDVLNSIETHYIRKYMPLLNNQIPNESSRGYTKKKFNMKELKSTTGLDKEQVYDMYVELWENKYKRKYIAA